MEKFSFTARLLHWSIALLLLIQIPLAWYMIELPLSADKLAKYALHKSFGMLLFTLAVIRLVRAILGKRPQLPPDTKPYEITIAKTTQGLLYAIIILMPITGWLMSSAANVPVTLFGMLTLPNPVEPNKALMEILQIVHETLSLVLLTLVSLHVLAGLKHHFIGRNNVLYSMLPLVKKR